MENKSSVKAPPELLKAQKMANLLDTAISLPIIPIKIGLDSIIGLIPGVGDAIMLGAALRIVWLGKKMGMPKSQINRMFRNAALDFGLGFIPLIGDLVDFFYKANRANVRIMEQWWVSQHKAEVDAATKEHLAAWENQLTDS